MRDVFNSKPKSHQSRGRIWREVRATLLDQLGEARAKPIARTPLFFTPQTDRGLAELPDILDKTLSKAPAQRYQTGGELAADLHRVVAVLPASIDAGRAPDNASAPTGQHDENAMLATVVTPAPVSSTVPERASADIRL